MTEYDDSRRQDIMNQYNQLSDENNELSMTLVERRRRLHELADEINQWEDQETPAIKGYPLFHLFSIYTKKHQFNN
jgi:chromosome segregation ATPase